MPHIVLCVDSRCDSVPCADVVGLPGPDSTPGDSRVDWDDARAVAKIATTALRFGSAGEWERSIFDTEAGEGRGHRLGVPAFAISDVTLADLAGTRLAQGTQLREATASLLDCHFAELDRCAGRAGVLTAAAQNSAPLSFDRVTGRLAIRQETGGHAVREGVAANGFVEVTVDGKLHSSDPTSRAVDRALAGATGSTVSTIRYDGSGQDTLTLGSQKLTGGLTVQATGATVITQDVATCGPLAIQASDLTVSGALQGSTVTLAASNWITVAATGRIDSVAATLGGHIDVAADIFVNSGQLHADGLTGGQIDIHADKILNAGPITADTAGPSSRGGQVQIAFTDSYVATTAALLSASSVAGTGGDVSIDGGSAGHLFSSGHHVVTGLVGGSIDLFGRDIVLAGATLDASGAFGGGTVRVGGVSEHRRGLVDTQTVTVTAASTIRADAQQSGNGGRIFVGADQTGAFDGTVSARGGPVGGSGGLIELSGKGDLSYGGSADAGATEGKSGTLILDPKNITIGDAPVGVFPQFDLINPHPTAQGTFSAGALSNGNILAEDSSDDFGGSGAGAVYLFNGLSGALISSLVGSHIDDRVGYGSFTPLSDGNYVLVSTNWSGHRGAVTWFNGLTGVSGVVSDANSLVGSNPNDQVGSAGTNPGVVPLSNGNYLVASPYWNGDRGAVTWGSGSTGVSGIVSAANSLVSSSPSGIYSGDSVGLSITTLNNGNYVVVTPNWNAGRGAVTWGSGTDGISGTISEADSLVGSDPGDEVGGRATGGYAGGITPLTNGNYVVHSPDWNLGRGAVTWVDGATGVSGTVSPSNSLVGSRPGDQVGDAVFLLRNGNYVVDSARWNGYRGAVTWGDGDTGLTGTVSEANSLVGSKPGAGPGSPTNPGDLVGSSITPLNNGNYVIESPTWSSWRGAVTWGDGSTGTTGTITKANSLVGSIPGDGVGQVIALTSGNYLVVSAAWNDWRGAVTWGNGITGVSGLVSAANSLVGSIPGRNIGDHVGSGGVTLLNNGNYVVTSPDWNVGHSAVTWGSGTAGVSGIVSAANSLFDSITERKRICVIALSNGNYVVDTPDWNGTRGAVTWGDGTVGVDGAISATNSLVGSNPGDFVGAADPHYVFPKGAVTPLTNGNYVVTSPDWKGERGAATWGDGSAGIVGAVSDANSLVGSQVGDEVSAAGIFPLVNGNYVVESPYWNGGRGAATWSSGSTGRNGIVSDANSLVGSYADDLVGAFGVALSNGNYAIACTSWNGNRGAVTWGDGNSGSSGTVSELNSLVGANSGDRVGLSITVLTNGNYVVESPGWNGFRGAVTWCNGSRGINGTISDANSLVGRDPWDAVGYLPYYVVPLSDGNYLVESPGWSGGRGAVTWVSGASGQTLDGLGMITPQNSLEGSIVNVRPIFITESPVEHTFFVRFDSQQGGRVIIGYTDPSRLTYATAQFQSLTITPAFLTGTLNTGTAVVLQASNDITVNSPITVGAGGHGGALTLQAGRSILLNASIATDNGALTLIANDPLANGVVDSQRDPGNAVISMAPGTTLDTGSGALAVELRNGAGLAHPESGAIRLQTVAAGSVSVINDGLSAGSDVDLGMVTTSGTQQYGDPHGTTQVTGDLRAAGNPITFNDSVVVGDGVSVDAGASFVFFAGTGTQTLQSGNGSSFVNLLHSGPGTLRLTSGLTVIGTLLQSSGTFDANDQSVTVTGSATVAADTLYLAGTAPQTFAGGLEIIGTFTSSGGPMIVSGPVAVLGGQLKGQGTVGPVTALGGSVAPGGTAPGILSVAGPVISFSATTLSISYQGPAPGSEYSQLQASGTIFLGNSSLSLVFGSEPPVGSNFEIIKNTGSGPIFGTFNGLEEGTIFTRSGYQFQISYQGGTGGRSVVLTRLT